MTLRPPPSRPAVRPRADARHRGALALPSAFLANLEYAAYDALRARRAAAAAGGRIVIVDVDERSLSAIGQWPWRRDSSAS